MIITYLNHMLGVHEPSTFWIASFLFPFSAIIPHYLMRRTGFIVLPVVLILYGNGMWASITAAGTGMVLAGFFGIIVSLLYLTLLTIKKGRPVDEEVLRKELPFELSETFPAAIVISFLAGLPLLMLGSLFVTLPPMHL